MSWTRTYSLSRTLSCRVSPTPEVLALAAMFGLGVDGEQSIELYKDLEARLGAGRVIYITGDSGGGKSTLLRDIGDKACADGLTVSAPWLNTGLEADPEPQLPLVSALRTSVKEAVELLTLAGISDAFVWMRRPSELSDGQRERYRLARIMRWARKPVAAMTDIPTVILIDEFCARLDRKTAKAVAYQLRKTATRQGLCFVVATTHTDLSEDLGWDQRIYLSLGEQPKAEVSP